MFINTEFKSIKSFLFLGCFVAVFVCSSAFAQNGKDAQWESAGKQGVGTAMSLRSKVWFTLQGGSLTEVFYPTADSANVQLLQFAVVNPRTKKVETEPDEALHRVRTLNTESLSFMQVNTAKNGAWEIRKTYVTDPERNSLLIDVEFLPKAAGLDLYVVYDPSLKNSGMKDTAWAIDGILLSNEADVFSALKVTGDFSEVSNSSVGVNDGLDQLRASGKMTGTSSRAKNGNVIQVAKIKNPRKFTLVLSFGKTEREAADAANLSLTKSFRTIQNEYQKGWREYARKLPRVGAKYQPQFNYAAMVLRASEDKTYRGGNVASLSKPWITGTVANDAHVGGYHLVWSRDLYHVATAYIAIGDLASANRALDYLFTKQQKADGSYPQISWLDGRTLGDWIQMDEVSYPLILAYQLKRFDSATFTKHIKPTADYIVKTGPKTQQERWEEKPGYSPSTIAAEIAGLVCAAEIAQKNGDQQSANKWLATADDWAENVEKLTATTTGKYGDGNYYLRITQNGKPDAGEKIELNNNAGTADEREIIDAGFLELVRLGIKSPDDKLILKSLNVVDQILRVTTPNGDGFYRYNRDGYGEMYDGRPWNWDLKYTGKGHLWALLSGERGQYEIAECGELKMRSACLAKARKRLDAMSAFANEGMMIPEQVWDKPNSVFQFGEGAGSATPLAWSMAQFIRLAINLKSGKNVDMPDVVARRYGNQR
jgi:glucoamylase